MKERIRNWNPRQKIKVGEKMNYLICRLFHGIQWHSNALARDLDGIAGTYGICKCGKEYFKIFDTNRIELVPPNATKAYDVSKLP